MSENDVQYIKNGIILFTIKKAKHNLLKKIPGKKGCIITLFDHYNKQICKGKILKIKEGHTNDQWHERVPIEIEIKSEDKTKKSYTIVQFETFEIECPTFKGRPLFKKASRMIN